MILNLALSMMLMTQALPFTKGMYGVPSVSGMSEEKRVELLDRLQDVDAVFTPADGETIRFFKEKGYRVYVTVNAFGGSAGWKQFPDSRPVLADGRKLGEPVAPKQNPGATQSKTAHQSLGANPVPTENRGREAAIADGSLHGGICPSHEGWRAARLREISVLLHRFGGKNKALDSARSVAVGGAGAAVGGEGAAHAENTPGSGHTSSIDGIWLDFIRYPGVWENTETEAQYVQKMHAGVPASLARLPAHSAANHSGDEVAPAATSFRVLPLGIPDTGYCPRCLEKFSRDTGILLPMPPEKTALASAWLHKNRPYEWMEWKKRQINSFVSDVRALIGKKGVSPVLLGAFTVPWTKGEKGGAATYLLGQDPFALSEIVDVLSPMVYHRMVGKDTAWVGALTRYYTEQAKCAVWPIIQAEETTPAEFADAARYAKLGGAQGLLVYSFKNRDSALLFDEGAVPIFKAYRLSCLFDRKTWRGLSEAYISIWGERFLLEKHLPANVMQPLSVTVICPENPQDSVIRFENAEGADEFFVTDMKLVPGLPLPPAAPAPNDGFFYPGFFPIGIYGAGIDDLPAVKEIALNTVIVGGDGDSLKKTVKECRRLDLRYVLATPHDPELLKVYLERLADLPVRYDDPHLAFYVEDEPEMRAVPPGRTADVQKLAKAYFPRASTCMATVRPFYTREYQAGSDFFMIDNYPFPNMPISWLGDSMDRAAKEVGRDRLLSVIQAFSDGDNWPSMPGWRQIDSLAFLSIIHGSRGVFFYTWSSIGRTEEGRVNLGRVAGRLNRIYPWLLEKNLPEPVGVDVFSTYRVDPQGRPGVHACLKRRQDELMLIAVNTLGAPVEARIDWKSIKTSWPDVAEAYDVFADAPVRVSDRTITAKFKSYETKIYIIKKKDRAQTNSHAAAGATNDENEV